MLTVNQGDLMLLSESRAGRNPNANRSRTGKLDRRDDLPHISLHKSAVHELAAWITNAQPESGLRPVIVGRQCVRVEILA